MKYKNTVRGIFVDRPNRFIAHVNIGGEIHVCHVKNTGRCRELLIPGVTVVLAVSDSKKRKTAFDLIAVYKGNELINIDSQAPNAVVGEWLMETDFFGEITHIKPECIYGNSRFDFYIEADGRKIFIEVKGVTLEREGTVLFPDAPTERGVKHLRELAVAKQNGYEAYVLFVIQMQHCSHFEPNRETHPEFADALSQAAAAGVELRAMSCHVGEDFLSLDAFVDMHI
jgi:sugar fermentation stimulation protein A